jgi:transaldolase
VRLFLDTANLDEIAAINAWGVLDGVTTNPTLAAKEGIPFDELVAGICAEVDGPVSAEVVATDTDGMLDEAADLAAIADNVVIKLPLTPAGLAACAALTEQRIPTNVTLCFSPTQAILAAHAGATFVSPFVGRIDDLAGNGIGVLDTICSIYRTQGYATQVLAASLRGPQHVTDAARVGAHAATLPTGVFRQMVAHPQTDAGLDRFLSDWAAYQQTLAG